MQTKEELLKEHAKWTVKYMDAKKHLDELLPPMEGKLQSSLMTDLLVRFRGISNATKDMEIAFTKMQKIHEKLSQLQQ